MAAIHSLYELAIALSNGPNANLYAYGLTTKYAALQTNRRHKNTSHFAPMQTVGQKYTC